MMWLPTSMAVSVFAEDWQRSFTFINLGNVFSAYEILDSLFFTYITDGIAFSVVQKNVQHLECATETTLCRKVGVGAATDLVTYVHTTRLAVILSKSFLSRSGIYRLCTHTYIYINCMYMYTRIFMHTQVRKRHMYKWHTHTETCMDCHWMPPC